MLLPHSDMYATLQKAVLLCIVDACSTRIPLCVDESNVYPPCRALATAASVVCAARTYCVSRHTTQHLFCHPT